jgi:hypothetical protein
MPISGCSPLVGIVPVDTSLRLDTRQAPKSKGTFAEGKYRPMHAIVAEHLHRSTTFFDLRGKSR